MLSELTNENLVKLNIEASDWEDAIRKAAAPLVDENKVESRYVDEIIKVVKETGPYIVITKYVALPHARPEAGAIASAIGIATLKNSIVFNHEENDPVKYIFCLSAKDNESHLSALSELVSLLENEDFYKVLDTAKTNKEVIEFVKSFEQ